ncbi:hypothetical protein FFV06_21545 [Salmonella enterica]|nr:hypothetical protein [Salmonella enterica]EAW4136788.1 hypothetical protein [Salmonella enterica]EAX8338125.1 hypothetical protein [Salmonella enterica]ECC2509615.1 hypothetical protein [Salmonella enterica]ECQ7773493.1 hypothetical protein [Salmonella enterica]
MNEWLFRHGASSLPDWSSHCWIYQHLWGTENQGLSRYSPVHYLCCLVLFVRGSLCLPPLPFAWRGEYRAQLRRHRAFR